MVVQCPLDCLQTNDTPGRNVVILSFASAATQFTKRINARKHRFLGLDLPSSRGNQVGNETAHAIVYACKSNNETVNRLQGLYPCRATGEGTDATGTCKEGEESRPVRNQPAQWGALDQRREQEGVAGPNRF